MLLTQAILTNKRVILRTDYNVPIQNGIIQSTKRIDASLETLKYIIDQKPSKVIIISHLGRPKGNDKSLTLEPIRVYLEEVLKKEIVLSDISDLDKINSNTFIMLENIRFHKEETKVIESTDLFREKLTNLGDVFINDAFGCCHRSHSSMVGINTKEKYIGYLVDKEIIYLKNILEKDGVKTLILGGSKISDKIQLIKNLIPKVDNILIGGGMAFTFLRYNKIEIGKSLFDEEGIKLIPEIMEYAKNNSTNIYLPEDYVCNHEFSNEGNIKYCDNKNGIDKDYMGLDIGYNTIDKFKNILESSDIIIWNGPVGVFEFSKFEIGSKKIMQYISKLDATTIIGGGDTASCCEKFKLEDKMTHLSTGGGASLELLQGNELPGLSFVEEQNSGEKKNGNKKIKLTYAYDNSDKK